MKDQGSEKAKTKKEILSEEFKMVSEQLMNAIKSSLLIDPKLSLKAAESKVHFLKAKKANKVMIDLMKRQNKILNELRVMKGRHNKP